MSLSERVRQLENRFIYRNEVEELRARIIQLEQTMWLLLDHLKLEPFKSTLCLKKKE
jgi:hypothetical protein